MPKDYIPNGDSEILEFADNFVAKIDGNETMYGLVRDDATELIALRDTSRTSYDDNLAKQSAARTSREQKDMNIKALVNKLRGLAARVQANPTTDDMMRTDLNLTVKDTTQTPIGAPTTRPMAEVDTSVPLRHTIIFFDTESSTKGKPEGVKGAEIWCKIGGEATMNEDDYRYLGTDTASPYLAIHKAENVGKQAHYLLRWVNPKNEAGAWSNAVSATITG